MTLRWAALFANRDLNIPPQPWPLQWVVAELCWAGGCLH